MNSYVQPRLQLMMFLQFFTWGAWFTTLGLCLGTNGLGDFIGGAFGSAPIAAIIAPLFLGLVADRFFASERIMGILFLVGGAIMCFAPSVAASGNGKLLVWVFIAHMLCYMPTLGLSNTIAFTNIRDRNHFPRIRVWGTIGWIAAGLLVGLLAWSDKFIIFWLAGISSLVLGAYCFTLPHTPPPAKDQPANLRTIFMLDALKLLSNPPYFIFILCSVLICIPLGYYFSYTSNLLGQVGFKAVAATMSLGQMSEIVFMLMIPFFFRRLGVKWMILVGMAAWVIRYLLFAFAAPDQVRWMILLAIILHGICYDFFFVTGFMYTDQKAPREIRGQAQGMLVFFTQGVGLFFGYMLAAALFNTTVIDYTALDLATKVAQAEQMLAAAEPGDPAKALRLAISQADTAIGDSDTESIAFAGQELTSAMRRLSGPAAPSYWKQFAYMFTSELPPGIDKSLLDDTMQQWKSFWMVPAGLAAAVLVLFALLFHDPDCSIDSGVEHGDTE